MDRKRRSTWEKRLWHSQRKEAGGKRRGRGWLPGLVVVGIFMAISLAGLALGRLGWHLPTEALDRLREWDEFDTWIVITGGLAAMACAVPGCFLVVRRLSMMGDAISHAALPGIVLAFLLAQTLQRQGWLGEGGYEVWRQGILFLGAMVLGLVCALGTAWVQRHGQVEASAALGVVFTSLFALGLLLIRLLADDIDLDPDCVLYGTLENVVLDVVGSGGIPRAARVNGLVLVANLFLVGLLFKELKLSAFDPGLANSMGFPAQRLHYLLMAVTAGTLVAAFESVGSILVIAMLIVPPATASLLTDRLSWMIGLSLLIAAASAFFGHMLAITLPALIFHPLGYPDVMDAGTAGMMATAAGGLFIFAMFVAPRYGIIPRVAGNFALSLKMAGEDLLGIWYREEEHQNELSAQPAFETGEEGRPRDEMLPITFHRFPDETGWRMWLAVRRLRRMGYAKRAEDGWQLTPSGREAAQRIVRAHRLWESYLARHFSVEDPQLHESASRAEHFIDEWLRTQLSTELDEPDRDPHGSVIPSEEI